MGPGSSSLFFLCKNSLKERRSYLKLYTAAINTTAIEEQLKQHQMRVSKICEEIARALNMPYSSLLELLLAAQLHDVGKLWIPQQILNKPESLNKEEMEIMKKHVFFWL